LEDRSLLTPTVSGVSPATLGIGVAVGAKVSATFSTAMQAATINTNTFEVLTPGNVRVPGTISYNPVNHTATLDSNAVLAYNTTYTAVAHGGTNGVKDSGGTPLAADFRWTFTTALAPDQGPGGPILVVTQAANPFSSYYPEILRAEGLNEFLSQDISTVTAATLAAHSVVLLGEMPLTSAQVQMFTTYVNNGGNLIAMRPDPQLAGLLGLQPAAGTLTNAYLRVRTSSGPGAGITNQIIQFHGTADDYTLNGATTVATLYRTATASASMPAVTLRSVGTQGGQAAAFTFDLARSVVLTRQGNPAWAGQYRIAWNAIFSTDLFYGPASFDPQPNWEDVNKVRIPQADEQQRLLANLIGQMDLDRMPLPRFWYLPNGAKAVVLMSADDHYPYFGEGLAADRMNLELAHAAIGGQPVRSSANVALGTGALTEAQADTFTADGFEVTLHVTTNPDQPYTCVEWTSRAQLDSLYTTELNQFRAQFPSIPSQSTDRTHCYQWSDYDSQPQVEFDHRIRLDTNYTDYPGVFTSQTSPGLFTGSGLPMRFATAGGQVIDTYQAPTQITDDIVSSSTTSINTLLDNAQGSLGYYGVFTVLAHTDVPDSTTNVANPVIASAASHHVPVLSGREVLAWLDGRNGSQFTGLSWNNATHSLTFQIAPADGAAGLQAMVPRVSAQGTLAAITRGGTSVSFTTQRIKGVQYAFFPATAGTYTARYTGGGPGAQGDDTSGAEGGDVWSGIALGVEGLDSQPVALPITNATVGSPAVSLAVSNAVLGLSPGVIGALSRGAAGLASAQGQQTDPLDDLFARREAPPTTGMPADDLGTALIG
jgi:hypothetical protein